MDYSHTWGVCLCIPGIHDDLVHIEDRADFLALNPNAKVFQCVAMAEDGMLIVKYGDKNFRMDAKIYRVVNEPTYKWNEQVEIVDKSLLGKIIDINWHLKDGRPYYFLEVNGRKKSKRYTDDELKKVES